MLCSCSCIHRAPGACVTATEVSPDSPPRPPGVVSGIAPRCVSGPHLQNSHAIRLDKISTTPQIVAIPTMPIQILKESQGNCMRNCWAHNSRAGQTAAPRSDGRDTYLKFRMQFECMNFQQSSETLQFQRCQFKSSNSHGGIACEIAGRTPGATGMESGPGARPQATTTRKPRPPPQPRAARAGTGRGSG